MSTATRKPNLPRASSCRTLAPAEVAALRTSLARYCSRNNYAIVVAPYIPLGTYNARARVRCIADGREAQVWAPVASNVSSGEGAIGGWSRNGWSNASTK